MRYMLSPVTRKRLTLCRENHRNDVELEHLKIKTRLIDEKFVSVMGGCVRPTLLSSHVPEDELLKM